MTDNVLLDGKGTVVLGERRFEKRKNSSTDSTYPNEMGKLINVMLVTHIVATSVPRRVVESLRSRHSPSPPLSFLTKVLQPCMYVHIPMYTCRYISATILKIRIYLMKETT